MMNKEYYVYQYTDPRNGEIFYIGQGKNGRYKLHLELVRCKKIKDIYLYKNQRYKRIFEILDDGLEPIITKLHEKLSKQEAMDLEHSYIVALGRKDLKNGTLLNLTNGYEFCENTKYCQPSPEAISLAKKKFYASDEGQKNKEYLSNLYKGVKLGPPEKWLGEERGEKLRQIRSINAKTWWDKYSDEERNQMFLGENNPFFGKTHSKETREKISKARKGSKMNEQTKEKIRQSLKRNTNVRGENHHNAKPIRVTLPDGSIEIINGNLAKWAGLHKMSFYRIKELANGEREEYKGYRAEWI